MTNTAPVASLDGHTLSVRALTDAVLVAFRADLPVQIRADEWKRPSLQAVLEAVIAASGVQGQWEFAPRATSSEAHIPLFSDISDPIETSPEPAGGYSSQDFTADLDSLTQIADVLAPELAQVEQVRFEYDDASAFVEHDQRSTHPHSQGIPEVTLPAPAPQVALPQAWQVEGSLAIVPPPPTHDEGKLGEGTGDDADVPSVQTPASSSEVAPSAGDEVQAWGQRSVSAPWVVSEEFPGEPAPSALSPGDEPVEGWAFTSDPYAARDEPPAPSALTFFGVPIEPPAPDITEPDPAPFAEVGERPTLAPDPSTIPPEPAQVAPVRMAPPNLAEHRQAIGPAPTLDAAYALLAFQQPVMVASLRPRPAEVRAHAPSLPSAVTSADVLRELAALEGFKQSGGR